MKVYNKFVESKKEPYNKNDIWFDGSVFNLYRNGTWEAFTLPIDAAEKVAEVIKCVSEVYQEKLNAGYGIIIEGNRISVDPNLKNYDDTQVWESIDFLQDNKANRSEVTEQINGLLTEKVNKEELATINGQSLLNGGNIVIEGGSGDSPIVIGEANNSAVLKGEYQGYKNKAISQTSIAIGGASNAGLKGWYYSGIDFTNNKIYLSRTQPNSIKTSGFTVDTSITLDDIQGPEEGLLTKRRSKYVAGDFLSIVMDKKFENDCKIVSVEPGIITVNKIPFTKDDLVSYTLGIGKMPDDFTVYSVVDSINYTTKQLTVRNWNQGDIDLGGASLAEGANTYAVNVGAHAEGIQTVAFGQYSHTEGFQTKAAYASHSEGMKTVALGEDSHSEGYSTIASGKHSHAEGAYTIAEAAASHAEGENTTASGNRSHSEGYQTTASGSQSHAEGNGTIASNNQSHAEGNTTTASGKQSHAEGLNTIASGLRAHAEGYKTTASGVQSHAEGQETVASGMYSHAGGLGTEAKNTSEVAFGKYNKSFVEGCNDESEKTLFTLGIGRSSAERKNAVEVKQNGDTYIIGIGGFTGANYSSSKSVQEVINELVNIINEITTSETN